MKTKNLLNAHEVARLLDMPLVTVQRWAYQGKIPCRPKDDIYTFRRNEIIEWAHAHDFVLVEDKEELSGSGMETPFQLYKAVEQGGIYHNLPGKDIYSVLKHATEIIAMPELLDRQMVFSELINREEIASTGIGGGVAIPHPRRPLKLEFPVAGITFLKEPVDFNAADGRPVWVLFLMFSPSTPIHLKLLSRFSFCLRDKEFSSLLEKIPSREQLIEGLRSAESRIKKP